MNNFFCSVFTEERTDNIPEFTEQKSDASIDSVVFDKNVVLKKLKNINPSKSSGPDNINARVLKELAQQLCEPIAILFEKSMSEGKLPDI